MARAESYSDATAANVRAEMARAGYSGRRVAAEIGWPPTTLSRKLRGTTPLRIDDLAVIAEFLGLPISHFLPAKAPTGDAA